MKSRLVLAGQPNQRNLDPLQSLIDGKDQRFKGGILVPVTNPLTGETTVYFEKRPGFETFSTPAACAGNAILFSRVVNKYITAFCGTDVYLTDSSGTNTSAGSVDPDTHYDSNILLQCRFNSDSEADESQYGATATLQGGGDTTLPSAGVLLISDPESSGSGQDYLVYSGGTGLNAFQGRGWTLEFWVFLPGTFSGASGMLVANFVGGGGEDMRVIYTRAGTDVGKMVLSSGVPIESADDVLPTTNAWNHIALVREEGVANTGAMYINGVDAGLESGGGLLPDLPSSGSQWSFGHEGTAGNWDEYYIDDIRLTLGQRYTGDFTPPERGSLPDPFV